MNMKEFYKQYDWSLKGEEWADGWSGSDMQWHGSILPRIQLFVPAPTIMEIGCGYGRWVKYLRPLCNKLILVDDNEGCVDHCRAEYADDDNITVYKANENTLAEKLNIEVDFIYSMHSLVHSDKLALDRYIECFSRQLSPNGVAFIHHSCAGDYAGKAGINFDLLSDYRETNITSSDIKSLSKKHNLICSRQELINWETKEMLDCFSVITRPGSLWGRSQKRLKNNHFHNEMSYWGTLATLYGQNQKSTSGPYLYTFGGEHVY